ncbi:hypothetical protein [Mucilaginibacter sp.]|uniref:hypothetical protein n=1 Tax=Mucilaginibacter sp. TaxID=1882438 RepID=UPI00284E6B6D|nr:hypothetical protein [Mucilaginibacter sp.]MDR3696886.1 hypothetical protein [Mucilaginibacter sp.]
MKKYLTLIAVVLFINVTKGQTDQRLNAKFIYEKLLDIYHNSSQADNDNYWGKFGFALAWTPQISDGPVAHRAIDNFFHPDKEFSVTTRTLLDNIVATEESAYATDDRKEYKNLLDYVKSLGYQLSLSKYQDHVQTDIFQMNKLIITFSHYYNIKDNDGGIDAYLSGAKQFQFKAVYTIDVN